MGSAFSATSVREARQVYPRTSRGIDAALIHGLSNARVESVNTKWRLLTRTAFGFRSPEALVALAMLDRRRRVARTSSDPATRTPKCSSASETVLMAISP